MDVNAVPAFEVGESPREAARRECCEELGRDVDVGDLLCVHDAPSDRVPADGVVFVRGAGSEGLISGAGRGCGRAGRRSCRGRGRG